MKRILIVFLLSPSLLFAQKKPLDHKVYDGWQSLGERMISNDGKWVVYAVNPQEGDGELFIESTDGTGARKSIPRGYNAVITEDSRYAVFKIRPPYKDTRDARIKKKKPEDFPKDSIGFIELGKEAVVKVPRIKSYKTPQKAGGWLAYQKEADPATNRTTASPTQRTVDSLKKKIDSLTLLVTEIKNVKAGSKDEWDADEDPAAGSAAGTVGTDLVLRNLLTGKERTFKNVSDYSFSPNGAKLAIKFTKAPKDSLSKAGMQLVDLNHMKADTILYGGNDFRTFGFTEDGSKLAFLAERDTSTSKVIPKTYGVYLYQPGGDSALLLVDKNTVGIPAGMTVSENSNITFSKSGNRLFFGIIPIPPLKDTSIVDFEVAKLDIWNYKDDYLQSQQLFNLNNELKKNFQTVYDFTRKQVQPLASKEMPTVIQTAEGDGDVFLAVTDTGRRVQQQWGIRQVDLYALNVATGKRTLVRKNLEGDFFPSSTGKYILFYDNKARNYFAWNGTDVKNITSRIKTPLYDEENDVPDDPNPYGIMGWNQGDSSVYVYDRFDIWKVDPMAVKAPVQLTSGRSSKTSYRYVKLDSEERFIHPGQPLYFRVFEQGSKKSGYVTGTTNGVGKTILVGEQEAMVNGLQKAKKANSFIYTYENVATAPSLTVMNSADAKPRTVSHLNPQQADYNWMTASLYQWKTFDGKNATGILYKPENFDPKKKYPMLVYFYEKLSDGLYQYNAPSPTPSRLNIPFFVSRGYLVFTPDISYTRGHPGKDAYNYIVSGAQALAKNNWVDAKNIGIQGQSWGGYQVAYLITATNMFKAAWAGAPVVNMFSAYGGIRWEGGINRQFQYEKTQSRIGATPWQRPDLYIENSPLFHLQKVTTPLVIMSNDADGAVPWYQGIEFFTDMRRLNKPVWLLNYNGEAHNLVERRNRKDIQIREQQFFDWLLKGEKPPKWIVEGVPAVKKGKDWGFDLVE